MPTVIDVLELLESDNSRNFKEDVLERNSSNELLKRTFRVALDPYATYFVSKVKKTKTAFDGVSDDEAIVEFLDLLEFKLAPRLTTGNAARELVQVTLANFSQRQQKWCTRILLRNLRCGVAITTINKVWPGLIKSFELQLADKVSFTSTPDGIKIDEEMCFPVYVDPKLDGLRCVAVKHNDNVILYKRSGQIIDTLPKISDWLLHNMPDETVFDGEAISNSNKFNDSSSVIMSTKSKKDDSSMMYSVFDVLTFEEFSSQQSSTVFRSRNQWLIDFFSKFSKAEPVVMTEGKIVHTLHELMLSYTNALDLGFEGVMVKDLNSPYVFDRTPAVKKLKPCDDTEGLIVGFYDAGVGTKREGMFGGFEVMFRNGIITNVGGGLSDNLKAQIQLEGPNSYVGKFVTIEYQPDPFTSDGFTEDGKARFPVFIRFRDVTDIDPQLVSECLLHSGLSSI